jgi:hypothetical protein
LQQHSQANRQELQERLQQLEEQLESLRAQVAEHQQTDSRGVRGTDQRGVAPSGPRSATRSGLTSADRRRVAQRHRRPFSQSPSAPLTLEQHLELQRNEALHQLLAGRVPSTGELVDEIVGDAILTAFRYVTNPREAFEEQMQGFAVPGHSFHVRRRPMLGSPYSLTDTEALLRFTDRIAWHGQQGVEFINVINEQIAQAATMVLSINPGIAGSLGAFQQILRNAAPRIRQRLVQRLILRGMLARDRRSQSQAAPDTGQNRALYHPTTRGIDADGPQDYNHPLANDAVMAHRARVSEYQLQQGTFTVGTAEAELRNGQVIRLAAGSGDRPLDSSQIDYLQRRGYHVLDEWGEDAEVTLLDEVATFEDQYDSRVVRVSVAASRPVCIACQTNRFTNELPVVFVSPLRRRPQ